jgi:hypothetical protein
LKALIAKRLIDIEPEDEAYTKMSLWTCWQKHRVLLGMRQESLPPFTSCRETVRKCSSREVITRERVCLFSQRARAYTLAYDVWQQQLEMSGGDENSVGLDSTAITPINIEKLVKLFKTHRRAMDVDSAFCKGVFLPIEGKESLTCSLSTTPTPPRIWNESAVSSLGIAKPPFTN